jgi:AcrR family transcriptional regulator
MLTKNSEVTKNNILSASKKLFWNNGYTNVSVRKIAEEAKCDIALISRYFQNKKGLFVVLLNKEFDDLKECLQLPKDEMVNGFVDGFIDSMDLKDEITFTRMLVMNGSDPEVGSLVRDKLQEASEILSKSLKKEAKPINISLLIASFIGISQTRKVLQDRELTKLNKKNIENY